MKEIFFAHLVVGLGLGVLGWLFLLRALPELSRPIFLFSLSLYWAFIVTVQRAAVERILPRWGTQGQQVWSSCLAFAQKMLGVVVIATPLYLVGEQVKNLPFSKVTTVILFLIYWMTLGLLAKATLGSPKITLPAWWGRQPAARELWDVLLWINANIFLMCLVFKGTRQALQGGGGFLNLVGIAVAILALYVLGIAATVLYSTVRNHLYRNRPCLQLNAREQIQLVFALGQKGAPFWLATGETAASGIILGIESPFCNCFRIAGLTAASCLSPRNGDKKLTSLQIMGRVLVNGPMLGLVLGTVVLFLRACGTPVPPGILLGIDLGAYPFVPCTLFLIGTAGLWEVLTGRMEIEGRKAKDLVGPFVFVLGMALAIIPVAAHVCSGWLWLVGMMDHGTALGLAQFFSHGCSPTAWGLVALMLGKKDARLYLLFFVITVLGSALTVPVIYGTCAF